MKNWNMILRVSNMLFLGLLVCAVSTIAPQTSRNTNASQTSTNTGTSGVGQNSEAGYSATLSRYASSGVIKVIPVETEWYAENYETTFYDMLEESIAEIETSAEEETLSYSEEDYEYMVMLLTGECQNQGWDCQVAVGSVALNRVAHESYPDTLKEVCLQKGQYACFRDKNAYRTPTELTLEVADYLLRNGSQLPADVVYQAQFKQGSGVYAKIGSEIFCYY